MVLGGSWARDEGREDSDVDLGLLYEPQRPPSLPQLRTVAREVAGPDAGAAVTPVGEWGPWVNGGAWLTVEGRRVDWLYRDLQLVRRTVDECLAGRPRLDYQPGHPFAFASPIYLGEMATARVLHDPAGVVDTVRRRLEPYPVALRDALVSRLWEADLSLGIAAKPAARGDAYHVSGCLFRTASVMTAALYAHNGRWLLNEKGSLAAVSGFADRPDDFAATVTTVLGSPGVSPAALRASVDRFAGLLAEVSTTCLSTDTPTR